MSWVGVGLSLILPWLAGALAVRRLWPHAAPAGVWPLAMGYGYLLSMLAAGLTLELMAPIGLRPAFWVLLLGFGALTVWGVRGLRHRASEPVATGLARRDDISLYSRVLFILLLAWMGLRLVDLALEVWWQPLFPWDAWTTWAVRARVWSDVGELVPFVSPETWLADDSGSRYTIAAWTYPKLVSLLGLWPTLALDGWSERAANLPWLGCFIALGLGFYGQARLWGASPMTGLVALWGLMSLPLLETHVALAGYADLWLASALGLSVIAFAQWSRNGDWRQGVLCGVLAAAWPFLKLEGGIWLLLFVPALIASRLAGRGMRLALLGVLAIGVIVLVAGQLGLVEGAVRLPIVGRFDLAYHDSWDAVGRGLFLYENWHLLGYVLVLACVGAIWRILKGEPAAWLRAESSFVLGSVAMLGVLFFFTDAYRWAEQGTSLARLLLQFMPVYVFFLLSLWLLVRESGTSAMGRRGHPKGGSAHETSHDARAV